MPERRRYERGPDTLLLMLACTVTAASQTASGQVPPTILQIAPLWLALVWSAAFAASGALVLVGVLWHEPILGRVLEFVGRLGLSGTSLGYAAALMKAADGFGSALVVGILAGIAVACIWRAVQLRKYLSGLSKVSRRGRRGRRARRAAA